MSEACEIVVLPNKHGKKTRKQTQHNHSHTILTGSSREINDKFLTGLYRVDHVKIQGK